MSDTELPPGATLLPARAAPQPADLPPGAALIEDPYRKAAIAERDALVAKGITPPGEGYTGRLTHGLTLGWGDEAVAGLMTPFEMIKRGTFDPREGYAYAKARENLANEKARENTGLAGSAIEVLGGLASGGRAVLGGALPAASSAIRQAPGAWNAVGRYFGNTGKGAIIGGIGGAGEGDTLAERGTGAAVGSVLGGTIAAAAPAVIKGIGYVAQPLTNQFRRFASSSPTAPISNVEDIATAQLANTLERSGKTGAQVAREVADANAAGQPYVVADAIGTEGQRRLAAVAKSPGPARQWIDEDLGQRDLGRKLRAQEIVETGLGVPRGLTAEEAALALTRRGQTASRPFYQAAESVQPVWSPRMQQFFEHPEYQKALREGFHVERTKALAEGRTFNPRDYAITDFNAAGDPVMSAVPNMKTIDLMKKGVDQILNKQRNPLTGKLDTNDPYIQALQNSQRAFLREVDSLNPAYGQARAIYAGPAQVRSAVERGQSIPMAGRPEDTIRRFNAAPATEQLGTRIGIADRIARQLAQGSETGPLPAYLRNPKGRQELDWMSLHQGPRQPAPVNPMARPGENVPTYTAGGVPGRGFQPDPMRRALDREATMRSTYSQARGGSQTAENLADMVDTLPPAPDTVGVISNLLSGNWMGAAKAIAPAAGRAVRGETEAQRAAIARVLMERDPNEIAAAMQRIEALQARRQAASTAQAGAAAGAGGAGGDNNQRLRRIYITGR